MDLLKEYTDTLLYMYNNKFKEKDVEKELYRLSLNFNLFLDNYLKDIGYDGVSNQLGIDNPINEINMTVNLDEEQKRVILFHVYLDKGLKGLGKGYGRDYDQLNDLTKLLEFSEKYNGSKELIDKIKKRIENEKNNIFARVV